MKKIPLIGLLIFGLATLGLAQPGLPLETELKNTNLKTAPKHHQTSNWSTLTSSATKNRQEVAHQDLQLPQFFDPSTAPESTLRSLVPYAVSSMTPLGLFCNMELQIQKRANFPIRVRLGEVDYTERLEYGEHFRLGRTDYAPRSSDRP